MNPNLLEIMHDMRTRSLTANKKRRKAKIHNNPSQHTEESLQPQDTLLSASQRGVPVDQHLSECVIDYLCCLVVRVYGLEESTAIEELVAVYFVFALWVAC